MNIICLIDNLGPGGAQRQLTSLAVALSKRRHTVSVLTYHPHDFFKPRLDEESVPVHTIASTNKVVRLAGIRKALHKLHPDVVLAFMTGTCAYAEMSRIAGGRWGLVVSERIASPQIMAPAQRFLRVLHHAADAVVTNSHTNRLLLQLASPGLSRKLCTIYNIVDLEYFRPATGQGELSQKAIKLLMHATYHERKNILQLIDAVALAQAAEPAIKVRLDCYGGFPPRTDGSTDHTLFDAGRRKIENLDLTNSIFLHEATPDVIRNYTNCDVVVLPSFFEGLPNVVCEALGMGKPVLMSDVCDAGNLVHSGINGCLFDPHSVESMARAIVWFLRLSLEQREAMGKASRKIAEELFSEEKIVGAFESVLQAASVAKTTACVLESPPVPDSAVRTVEQYQMCGLVPVRKRGPSPSRDSSRLHALIERPDCADVRVPQ